MKTFKMGCIPIIILCFLVPFLSCSKGDQSNSKKELSVEEAKKIIKEREEKDIIGQAKAIKQEELDRNQRMLDQTREAMSYGVTGNLRAAASIAYAYSAVYKKDMNINLIFSMLSDTGGLAIEPSNKFKITILDKIYTWEYIPPATINGPFEGKTLRQAKDMSQKELDQLPKYALEAARDGITGNLRAAASIAHADAAVNNKQMNASSVYQKLVDPKGMGIVFAPPDKFKARVGDKTYIWTYSPPASISSPKPEK